MAARTYVIVSCKGGVGKSTLTASLANHAAEVLGRRVAVLDLDVTSPSIPKVFGCETRTVGIGAGLIQPLRLTPNLSVMSVDSMLPDKDQPVALAERMKIAVVEQVLDSVEYGKVDDFFLDTPPTTSSELHAIVKLCPKENVHVVFVTQRGDVSLNSVIKSIRLLKEKGYRILGLVSNMSTALCRHCGKASELFHSNGMTPEIVARQYGIPFLGDVPVGTPMRGNLLVGGAFADVAARVFAERGVRFPEKKIEYSFLRKLVGAWGLSRAMDRALKDG